MQGHHDCCKMPVTMSAVDSQTPQVRTTAKHSRPVSTTVVTAVIWILQMFTHDGYCSMLDCGSVLWKCRTAGTSTRVETPRGWNESLPSVRDKTAVICSEGTHSWGCWIPQAFTSGIAYSNTLDRLEITILVDWTCNTNNWGIWRLECLHSWRRMVDYRNAVWQRLTRQLQADAGTWQSAVGLVGPWSRAGTACQAFHSSQQTMQEGFHCTGNHTVLEVHYFSSVFHKIKREGGMGEWRQGEDWEGVEMYYWTFCCPCEINLWTKVRMFPFLLERFPLYQLKMHRFVKNTINIKIHGKTCSSQNIAVWILKHLGLSLNDCMFLPTKKKKRKP